MIECKKPLNARCPHCGERLTISSLPQYVFQCKTCEEDFLFFEANYGTEAEKDEDLVSLWEAIEDEPFDPNAEVFENHFYGIGELDEPLTREDVWRWFDTHYKSGVASLVNGGGRTGWLSD